MKFKWTIYRKIQLLIVMVLLVVYGVSNIALEQFINQKVRDDFKVNVVNTSILLQKNVELMFSDTRNSLEFVKKQYEGEIRDDQSISEYLTMLHETKDYIINAFIAYEDGAYMLEPKSDVPSDFDPRERSWYKTANESRKVKWSLPYPDVATDELVITGSTFVEFSDIKGVLGVDIKLSILPSIINATMIGKSGFIVLVNDDGYIIVDSKNEYANGQIQDQTFLDSNIITGSMETSKGLYYLRRLNQTNIRLVAFLPSEDLVAAAKQVKVTISTILIVALIIGIFISYFISRRITRPLENLTKIMLESKQRENLLLFEEESNDEISTLIDGYNSMAVYVNNQNDELKAISEELIESEKKLQQLAYFDYLTGLPNRVSFENETKENIKLEKHFSLFYVDLDNFKYINDTYGHNHGDFVLKEISKRMKVCCDKECFGARLSGDEFGILILGKHSKEELLVIANEMLRILNQPIHYNELEFSLTGSIGISLFPEDGVTFGELLSNADIAMYEAKNNSKNRFTIFNQELRKNMMSFVNLESKLLHSIEKGELFLCYQPLIDFNTKQVTGFEALVRWEEESMGMIYPDVFIPIAERNLFINELGYFVIEQAIKFGNELYERYGRYFEMNVNVSLVQLHIESFVEDVIKLLDNQNYPYEYLNLEITESVGLETDKKIHQKLSNLRNYGIPISLDDFGTGYSSLNHLLHLSLTHLKIDRMIISEATKKGEVYQLIKGIVEFAHAMNLKVIAEGIEDEHMEKMMKKMDIDYAQGYLYSRPIKDVEIIKYLDEINHS